MKSPEIDQKSPVASPSYHDESWLEVEEDPSDSPRRSYCSSPRSGLSLVKVDVLRTWSPPDKMTVPSAIGNIKKDHHFGSVHISFALSLQAWISDASTFSNSSTSATKPRCLLSRFSPRTRHDRGIFEVNFLAELMQSRQVFGRNRVIFDHRTKRNYGSFKWFAESPFVRCFPIRQEILHVSQIGNPPTIFIKASGSEADSREELAGASLWIGTLSSTRFSVKSSNHSGRSRNGFPAWSRCLHLCLCFAGSCDGVSPCCATLTFTSCWNGMQRRNYCFLRYWCRRCTCSSAWRACRQTRDNDRYVVLRAAFYPSAFSDELWLLTTGPLVRISVIFAEFSEWENGQCIFEKLYRHE